MFQTTIVPLKLRGPLKVDSLALVWSLSHANKIYLRGWRGDKDPHHDIYIYIFHGHMAHEHKGEVLLKKVVFLYVCT